jgi:hypothetical protein
MRLPTNPRQTLASHLTTAAVALEQLPDGAGLKVAGEKILTIARSTLAEHRAESPFPLFGSERREMSKSARYLTKASQALATLWRQEQKTRQPLTWMLRSRDVSEAYHFAKFFDRLSTLEPELRQKFHAAYSEYQLREQHAKWCVLSGRIADRKKILPLLQKTAALIKLLSALIQVVRLQSVDEE